MAEVVAIKPAVADGPILVSQDKGILRLTLASPPANALSLA
ncbi:enoyl-CoA hydratase, partial [Mesorhizobium sp. M2A.F.Ca.ET.029.05.1.1]